MKLIHPAVGLAAAAALLVTAACGSSTAALAPSTVTATETHTIASGVPAVRFTSTVTATATVTATVTAVAPAPVTATVTSNALAATTDPSGPKEDGTYRVPQQLSPGNWQCSEGGESTFWTAHDSTGEVLDNGFSTIANIPGDTFSVEFRRCTGTWVLLS